MGNVKNVQSGLLVKGPLLAELAVASDGSGRWSWRGRRRQRRAVRRGSAARSAWCALLDLLQGWMEVWMEAWKLEAWPRMEAWT